MNILKLVLGLVVVGGTSLMGADSVATQYLQFVYGGDGVDIDKICWPNDDVWMIRGQKSAQGLAQLRQEKISHGANEVVWENIQNALCIVEIRDGKADPRFLLDQVYQQHRQLILQFIYASLGQDQDMLKRMTTKPANVKFGRAEPPAGGDMGVYEGIIGMLPVVRVSVPAEDKTTRSITYRVPLGKKGLALRLVKQGSTWLVDSEQRLEVPLDFFFK